MSFFQTVKQAAQKYFYPDKVAVVSTHPNAGETWQIKKSSGDPFEQKTKVCYVKIIDVKKGWVRYAFPSVFTDERMEVERFLRVYVRASK